MEILILAAGEGKRIEKISKNRPKSLLTLDSEGHSSLSLLLQQFSHMSVSNIFISLGYSFDFFYEQLKDILTKTINSVPVIPIDARPNYIKGPLFSFLAGKIHLINSPLFGLFPADTLFSTEFFETLKKKTLELNQIHIFYYYPSICPKSGFFLKFESSTDHEDNPVLINDFISVQTINSTQFNSKSIAYMLPVLFFPGSIFNFADIFAELGKTTVIQIVIEWIKQKKMYTIHHLDLTETPFYDIDTPEDYNAIREKFI